MSQESTTPDLVEPSRRALDATNRRDFDAAASLYAADAVCRGPEIGTFEGRSAIRGLLEDFLSAYEDFQAEPEEIIDLGNGVTFAMTVFKARLTGSSGGLKLRFPSVTIWTDGIIERQTHYHYTNIDEARAAAERLA